MFGATLSLLSMLLVVLYGAKKFSEREQATNHTVTIKSDVYFDTTKSVVLGKDTNTIGAFEFFLTGQEQINPKTGEALLIEDLIQFKATVIERCYGGSDCTTNWSENILRQCNSDDYDDLYDESAVNQDMPHLRNEMAAGQTTMHGNTLYCLDQTEPIVLYGTGDTVSMQEIYLYAQWCGFTLTPSPNCVDLETAERFRSLQVEMRWIKQWTMYDRQSTYEEDLTYKFIDSSPYYMDLGSEWSDLKL